MGALEPNYLGCRWPTLSVSLWDGIQLPVLHWLQLVSVIDRLKQ